MLLLFGISSLAIAKSNPLPNVNVFGFKYKPNCGSVTVSASASGTQTCNGFVTTYTVTSSCSEQPSSCTAAAISEATIIAGICATIRAERSMRKLMTFLPPC